MRQPGFRRCFFRPHALAFLLAILVCAADYAATAPCRAGEATPAGPESSPASWSFHAQNTDILQGVTDFDSPYRGANSLTPDQTRETVTVTLFIARRLWEGAIVAFDPEYAQGAGLNHTHGVAGFPNGEATKAGSPRGKLDIERLYFSQTIGLGGEQEDIPDARNQPATRKDVSRLSFTIGKLAASDLFDDNAFAHDPRAQFLNWSVWESGAWDYPADAKGYTVGLSAELNQKAWALRYGAFQLPRVANGLALANDVFRTLAQVLEWEGRYKLRERGGKIRLLAFANRAPMGRYDDALSAFRANPNGGPADVTPFRAPHWKYGGAVNVEQEVAEGFGAFLRLSIADGQTENWAFTDIDRSATAGLSLKGTCWGRTDDTVGLAGSINGLSVAHRDYFAAGGLGILVGDGRLNYAPEEILEFYYDAKVTPLAFAHLMFDYQFIRNPGYNHDRGPANVLSTRLHLEY
ncbi:MAG: carbohydrate porin [Verrucomicrobia bacterium]|nr:carbohydrate porin [Verrucomicrobiota bacterium]